MEEAEGSNSKRKRPPEGLPDMPRWSRRELKGHNQDHNQDQNVPQDDRKAGNILVRMGRDKFRRNYPGFLPKWHMGVRTSPQKDLPNEVRDQMPQSSQSQDMADDEMDDMPQSIEPADMAWDDDPGHRNDAPQNVEDEADPDGDEDYDCAIALNELAVTPTSIAYVRNEQYDKDPDVEMEDGVRHSDTPIHSPPSSIPPPPRRHLPAHQRPGPDPRINATAPYIFPPAHGLRNGRHDARPLRLVGRQGPTETVVDNTLHPYGRQGQTETVVDNGLAFYPPSAYHRPRGPCTGGFRPTGNCTDWGIKGRQQNFEHRIMDIVIFERLDMEDDFPSVQDGYGRLKQTSKVRFNTRNLKCPVPGPGDMILRIGQLWKDNTHRIKFHFSPTMELYEAVWEETPQRGLVRERDSKGELVWEETSHVDDPLTEDRSPWEWPFFESDQPLRAGDSLRGKSPNTIYKQDMARCLLLRRKKGGAHDHDCQKLDWYPTFISRRNFLLHGDYLVRFGVMDLTENPDCPADEPHVLACVEAWTFFRRSSSPAGQLDYDYHIRRGDLGEIAGWIFLGRDECWMKGQYDIGFKEKRILPQTNWNLSEFVPEDEWPRGNTSLTVLH